MPPNVNPLLEEAAKDVPPDSSPANEQTPDDDASDPGPAAGDQSGKKGESGRTLDNVRGEFNRKFNDFRDELAELKGMLRSFADANTRGSSNNNKGTARTLEQLSASELEALGPQVPEENKAAYDQLLASKRQDEQISIRIEERLAQERFAQQRVEANTEAYQRFPELHNRSSRMYQETNRVLNEMGAALSSNDPKVLLHAASVAAANLGLSSNRRFDRASHVPGNTAPSRDSDAGTEDAMSQEDAAKIAKQLGAAMPGGKFSPEQLERIRERAKEYRENKHLFIKQ